MPIIYVNNVYIYVRGVASMKKFFFAICALVAVTAFIPASEVKAGTYDRYTCDRILLDFYNYDLYKSEFDSKYATLISLMSKGASASKINKAATDFATANANLAWVTSQVTNITSNPKYLADPAAYIATMVPKDPPIMNEPTSWAILTDKQKYRDAWKQQSYTTSQLVNQAAYNGDIASIGAYAQEQGIIAAWNEYQKGLPKP